MFALVFPQRARWVSTGGAAASAASAKTVARVTPPQGSVLAPRAGRGWPASWVSNGASAALRNGLRPKLVPFWTRFALKAGGGVHGAGGARPRARVRGPSPRAFGDGGCRGGVSPCASSQSARRDSTGQTAGSAASAVTGGSATARRATASASLGGRARSARAVSGARGS